MSYVVAGGNHSWFVLDYDDPINTNGDPKELVPVARKKRPSNNSRRSSRSFLRNKDTVSSKHPNDDIDKYSV